MGTHKYRNGFDITLHENALKEPYKIKKPSVIFVNSMSDLFHKDIPLEFLQKVFEVMNNTQHIYQIFTKRADILAERSPYLNWTDNIWQGVTVESIDNVDRIDYLRTIPSKVKYISFEPLLGDVGNLNLSAIDWCIVGGESGSRSRPIKEEWILNIKKQCDRQKALFYFKQWGGVNKKKSGRTLLGKTWEAMPNISQYSL